MKKQLLLFTFALIGATAIKAQGTASNAAGLAAKIADKLKDSLNLSVLQRNQLYDVNLQISDAKSAVRGQYVNRDSVRFKTQRIENARDSLYRSVFTAVQFDLYKQKKRLLVTAD